MKFNEAQKQYIDYKVYNITKIKNKYGFRIKLIYSDNSTGMIQKSGFKTLKEVNEVRNKTIAELSTRTFIISETITVKDFYTTWLEDIMKPKVKASTYDTYKNIVYNHIIPEYENMRMSTLDRGHIQRFYNNKAEYSHSIVRMCNCVINSSFNYAESKNIIKSNIAKGIALPREVKKKPYRKTIIDESKTLTEEQVQILIRESKDTPIYLQILFAVLMGLRKSEINGLKYSDIDYVRRKIHIQRQLGKVANTTKEEFLPKQYTKQEITLKTYSSNRVLDIPDILFEAILEEKNRYEKNLRRRKNSKSTPFRDFGYIICSNLGNPRSKDFAYKHYKLILKENNLPNIRFHDLRATYCTLLLKNNFNIKAISCLMGHSTEIVSVDVYGDKNELVKDCVKEITPFINRVLPDEKKQICDLTNDTEIINITEKMIKHLIE